MGGHVIVTGRPLVMQCFTVVLQTGIAGLMVAVPTIRMDLQGNLLGIIHIPLSTIVLAAQMLSTGRL